MDHFSLGFFSGLVVGLAAAVLLSRLAGGFRWISGIFGRDPIVKKLRDAEKDLSDARAEIARCENRLSEKDALIKKAMSSLADDAKNKAVRQ
jgi:hypothetical protein